MNFMPEKNPDIWMQIAAWWATHHNSLCGFTAGFVVALGRSFLYGKGSWRKKSIEAILCGILAYTARPILLYFQLSEEWITPIGAMLGLVGIDFIRATFLKIINKRVENE
ncbi:hypothetical protein A4G19_13065 [Pasteurellaceae bacterium Macca]|nr:hypothetical protein [Pasteurellaceae bacterium Macca]MCK3656429.1 hypothetical protein [Pasteurellaceae bacterium Macca]MCK3656626.1 hypothetical protein [Pasteurellaceae bacterium Macca]